MDKKKLLFLVLFTIVGFISLQVPFNKLMGSNVSFTLFDFFGPIAGAFLGSVFGIGSVLAVEVVNMLVKHSTWNIGSIIRLFPTLFAVYYFAVFSKKQTTGKWILFVPFISIFAFLAHPIGRQVPLYTLFWLIPFVAYKLSLKGNSSSELSRFPYRFRNNLYIRSLGATFTAHAIGGAAWIWAFNLPTKVWQGLIPVVIEERILFAAGIAGSYIVVKYALNFLAEKKILPKLEVASL